MPIEIGNIVHKRVAEPMVKQAIDKGSTDSDDLFNHLDVNIP